MTATLTAKPVEAEGFASGCGPLIQPGSEPQRPLRQQVFERIRAAGGIARVELARTLEISPASVTAVTGDLMAKGLILEQAATRTPGEAGRGRPPVDLVVNPKAGFVVGIKVSDKVNTARLVDFTGQVVAEAEAPAHGAHQNAQALIDDIETLLETVLDRADLDRRDLRAVGLGVPGMIDGPRGVVVWSPLLAARDLDLEQALSDRLGLRVRIDNDANLVTLAELWFGAGRKRSNFAVVTIEHGVGMGLVVNHRLYRGGHGLGMELGHVKVQLDGALCRCGQRGCLEAYVADYALVREATTALSWDRGSASASALLESLFNHAKAGNPAAEAIFHRAGRFLALGLANVVNLFDPDLILLSGERLRFDYLYADEVLRDMRAMTLNSGRTPPKVQIHAWGDLVWAQGAAALALEAATEDLLGANAA